MHDIFASEDFWAQAGLPGRIVPSMDGRTWTKKSTTKTVAPIKNILLPPPVFEAHYADGTIVRMSFATERGKPFNLARGKSVCDRAYAGIMYRRTFPFKAFREDFYAADAYRNNFVADRTDSFIEHETIGRVATKDYIAVRTPTKKSNTDRACAEAFDVLARLVTWAEFMGGFDASVWDEANRVLNRAANTA